MMSRSSRVLLVLTALLASVVLFGRPAPAADAPDGDKDPAVKERRDRNGRDDRRNRFATMMRAFRKQRAGEKLTEEEQAALDRVRRRREDGNRDRDRDRDRERGNAGDRNPFAEHAAPGQAKPTIEALKRLKHDDRLNVIDRAHYQIAEIHISQKEYDKAVEALQRLVKKSPDKLAISLTHLNLAEVYRKELSDKDQAVAQYKRVTGEYALEAQKRLASLFEELDQVDQAVATFEGIIKVTPDKVQKVLALRELAELLFRNNRAEEAVVALQQLTSAVTYVEAQRITKELSEAQANRLKAEQQERERTRTNWMRNMRDRFRGRARQRDAGRRVGGDRPQPQRPQNNKDAQPGERPIRPDADRL